MKLIDSSIIDLSVIIDKMISTCVTVPVSNNTYSWILLSLPKNTREVKYVRIFQGGSVSVALDVYIGDNGNISDKLCVGSNTFINNIGNVVACAGIFNGSYLSIYGSNPDLTFTICEIEVLGSSKFIFISTVIWLQMIYSVFTIFLCIFPKQL